ncbi:hypothetical protein C0J52_15683 [Blattella germanica]|nr:hypothetical protein C0J52_15683 [Blattella germanica]
MPVNLIYLRNQIHAGVARVEHVLQSTFLELDYHTDVCHVTQGVQIEQSFPNFFDHGSLSTRKKIHGSSNQIKLN